MFALELQGHREQVERLNCKCLLLLLKVTILSEFY